MMTNFRWLGFGAAALLVVAGCSSSPKRAIAPPTTTSTTGITSTTAAPAAVGGAATGGATTATTVAAGGPLPAGFIATDMTWISDTQGWALGTVPTGCAHRPCTSVIHTLDGGQTWAGLPAPKAYLPFDYSYPPTAPAPCSATIACIQGIRFANADTGYAYGLSSLWLTTDGGHDWTKRSSDNTQALEIDGTVAVRVIQAPSGGFQVESAPLGSTSWQVLPTPSLSGIDPELAVSGADLYLALPQTTTFGTQLIRSTDGGTAWSTIADPCGSASSDDASATAISAAGGGTLAVGCTVRYEQGAAFVIASANGGATFGSPGNPVLTVSPVDESIDDIAAATGTRLAVLVTSASTAYLAVSNDRGANWSVTQTASVPMNGPNFFYLGFEDATTGRAILTNATILTTTDGGNQWTPFTFPA